MADPGHDILARLIASPLYGRAGADPAATSGGGLLGGLGGALSPSMLKLLIDQITKGGGGAPFGGQSGDALASTAAGTTAAETASPFGFFGLK